MRVDVQFIPVPPNPDKLPSRTVVVIDVLRASSVIVHALSQGATEVIPVTTVEEAFDRIKRWPPGTTLLGGERGSRKIEGFDLGNSPREYTAERVRGKRVILTTTNGTKAFQVVSAATEILVGSFFNVTETANRCLQGGRDILLFASGTRGYFSLEDSVFGGMLVDRMLRRAAKSIHLSDASRAAHILYQRFEGNLVEAFLLSNHGKDLVELGQGDDLAYCSKIDQTTLVPIFKDGVIRVS